MRRAVCFLLALVFCFSLAVSVSAAVKSPAQSGQPVTVGDNPKTGDSARMELWVPTLIASALALVAVMFAYFKKFRKVN